MVKVPYTTKRGGVWYFYRRVPDDIRGMIGARVWKVSLRTDSAREAARLARPHIDETDLSIARARRMHQAVKPLAQSDQTLDRQGFIDALQASMAESLDGLKAARAAVDHRIAPVREMMGDDVANDLLKHGTIAAEWRESAAPHMALAGAVLRVGDAMSNDAPASTKATQGGSNELTDLFRLWVRRAKPAARTADEAEVAIRHFGEVNGLLPLASFTRQHVLAFRSAMLAMPKHLPRTDGALPVPAILEKWPEGTAERVSPTTARKRLGFVKTLFRLAVEEGLIDTSPAAEVRIGNAHTQQERLPFDKADLRRMFTAEPYQPGGERSGMFWLPLLGLLTGARAGELLQLTADDVRAEDGISYLDLTDDGDKQLKTAGSRRRVPLHPELIRLGFLDFASRQKGRLFADVPFGTAQISATYSKRFAYWLRGTVGINDSRKVLHSLRHTFKTLCREAGVGEDTHDSLTGHSNGSVGRRYGETPLTTLDNAIRAIKCPVDLSHMYPSK